jgi:hypothetical protein
MTLLVKAGGAFHETKVVHVKVSNVWKKADQMFVKKNSIWHKVWDEYEEPSSWIGITDLLNLDNGPADKVVTPTGTNKIWAMYFNGYLIVHRYSQVDVVPPSGFANKITYNIHNPTIYGYGIIKTNHTVYFWGIDSATGFDRLYRYDGTQTNIVVNLASGAYIPIISSIGAEDVVFSTGRSIFKVINPVSLAVRDVAIPGNFPGLLQASSDNFGKSTCGSTPDGRLFVSINYRLYEMFIDGSTRLISSITSTGGMICVGDKYIYMYESTCIVRYDIAADTIYKTIYNINGFMDGLAIGDFAVIRSNLGLFVTYDGFMSIHTFWPLVENADGSQTQGKSYYTSCILDADTHVGFYNWQSGSIEYFKKTMGTVTKVTTPLSNFYIEIPAGRRVDGFRTDFIDYVRSKNFLRGDVPGQYVFANKGILTQAINYPIPANTYPDLVLTIVNDGAIYGYSPRSDIGNGVTTQPLLYASASPSVVNVVNNGTISVSGGAGSGVKVRFTKPGGATVDVGVSGGHGAGATPMGGDFYGSTLFSDAVNNVYAEVTYPGTYNTLTNGGNGPVVRLYKLVSGNVKEYFAGAITGGNGGNANQPGLAGTCTLIEAPAPYTNMVVTLYTPSLPSKVTKTINGAVINIENHGQIVGSIS